MILTKDCIFCSIEGIVNWNTENDKFKQLLEDYYSSNFDINDFIKITFKKS